MEENLEEIKKQYELSQEENLVMAERVLNAYTHGKSPSERPYAIIVLAQPGAGKSGLMAFSYNQFPNALDLDIDKFRPYHPKFTEVSEKNPEVYEAVTGKFATDMILSLTPVLTYNKYNLILHKTRADDFLIKDTIDPLRKAGYDIILRVMAVHELESKISVLNRSINQFLRRGFCKWVEVPYHNKQYQGVVDMSEKIVDNKLVDAVEVYVRGVIPSMPDLVYSHVIEPKLLESPHMQLSSGEPAIGEYNPEKFSGIRDAIEKTRENQVPTILEGLDKRIENIKKLNTKNGREGEFFDELISVKEFYENKRKKLD